MFLPNAIKLLNIPRRKPRLLSLGVHNLKGRIINFVYKRFTHGYSPPPEQLTILVTDTCNFKCPMCQYVSSDSTEFRLNKHGPMELELFRKLLKETPGTPLVAFAGGEPLLHPQIDILISHAHTKGHPTWLTTNGWFLEKYAHAICDAGLDFLVVSLDGLAEIQNRIRGEQSFEHIIKGVTEIMKLPNRPEIFINIAISDLNTGQIVPVYEVAAGLGVDGIDINHLWMHPDDMVEIFNEQLVLGTPTDHVKWNIHPEDINIETVIDSIDEVKRRSRKSTLVVMENPHLNHHEIKTWYSRPAQVVKWKSSRCAWNRMRVWPDGRVKACRSIVVGNISREHAMAVWNGPRMRKFRQRLSRDELFPICVRCCDLAHR